ncbi:MAG: lipocalin-like domain-containing protein [Tannerellaceae bacterium]|jgi:hypothetical protein|nr:lipocalin-like domain-containing protein [Tannerellaceae bacterium]
MKKICCLFCFILLLASCNDTDEKLDGKWQLQTVDVEGTTFTVDTVYYNFQTSLFMYQIYRPASQSYSHCFGFKTVNDERELALELTTYGTDVSKFLPQTDWRNASQVFSIEQLNGQHLVLKNGKRTYYFRRF